MSGKTKNRPKNRLLEGVGEEPVSFGVWLRRQREARDISLREIADASKISLRYIEALEQDRFDILPARVFVHGFLRQYAKYVGLDADEVVNHFISSQQTVEDEEEREEKAPSPERRAGAGWWMSSALFAGVAGVLVLAALVAFKTERKRSQEAPAAAPATVASTEVVPPPPGSEVPSQAPDEEARAAAEPPQIGEPITGAGSAGAAPPPESDAAALSSPLRVAINFRERCWVVAAVDGAKRVQQEHAAGELLELDAKELVVLTLGNAGGVEIRVNGRPLSLGRERGEVARDVRIDLQTAKKLAEGT